eukprot:3614848-Rhodomonas_salina.1
MSGVRGSQGCGRAPAPLTELRADVFASQRRVRQRGAQAREGEGTAEPAGLAASGGGGVEGTGERAQ